MSRCSQLDALAALLAGDLPRELDWLGVLELANETLVTPQIYAAALQSGTVEHLPAEVRGFLQEVWRRNRERNRRLFRQLRDAVAALNGAGIEPMLLKGAAHWAVLGRPAAHDRILTDLDLLVDAEDAAGALRALEAAGFRTESRHDDPASHVAAELGRAQDVGMIDLHRRPPGPAHLGRAALGLAGQTIRVEWDGVRATAPSPILQIFLLVLHDHFHDGVYWRGEFALRHLLETADLSRRCGAADWRVLSGLARTRLIRNATDEQLLAAKRMCGARAPRSAERLWVRIQHARRRAQFGWPRFGALFVQIAG